MPKPHLLPWSSPPYQAKSQHVYLNFATPNRQNANMYTLKFSTLKSQKPTCIPWSFPEPRHARASRTNRPGARSPSCPVRYCCWYRTRPVGSNRSFVYLVTKKARLLYVRSLHVNFGSLLQQPSAIGFADTDPHIHISPLYWNTNWRHYTFSV